VSASVFEVVDAGVFEETADKGADGDVVADSGDTGAEGASATNEEVDFDAGLRGLVEEPDDALVSEGIHLKDDMAAAAFELVDDFALDELLGSLEEINGSYEELAVMLLGGVAGEVVEEVCGVGTEVFVDGHETQVGVETGGDSVVVACAEVGVAADLVAFFADYKQELGVDLQAQQAIDDVDALGFQTSGPFDVGFFVEAGFEFYQHGDLFAALVGFQEAIDDRRVAADPVEGHFDGEDGGVLGGLAQEVDYGIEGIEGVVEEDVAFADHAEDAGTVVELWIERWGDTGDEGFVP